MSRAPRTSSRALLAPAALLLLCARAGAQEAPATQPSSAPASEEPPQEGPGLEAFRVPVDELTEHFLGSTARPVRVDWRRSLVLVGVSGSELIERNNFGAYRLGGFARHAFGDMMLEAGATYVWVLETESSQILERTPYKQAGRPARVELEANVSYPLFEGVVTPLIDLLPPSEMVLSATGGGRYLFYPEVVVGDRDWGRLTTWNDLSTWTDLGGSLGTGQLPEEDLVRLEQSAPGAMSVDPAILHPLVGLTADAYYQPGLFVSARAMLALPLIAAVTGTRLGFWWELSLAAGWAF